MDTSYGFKKDVAEGVVGIVVVILIAGLLSIALAGMLAFLAVVVLIVLHNRRRIARLPLDEQIAACEHMAALYRKKGDKHGLAAGWDARAADLRSGARVARPSAPRKPSTPSTPRVTADPSVCNCAGDGCLAD